jgi:hypothetical protein
MEEFIDDIKETTEGYPVKNLKWNQLDNIIVGQVKCPILGRETFNEGYVVCQWRKNGSATNRFKGRDDLKLIINY